MLPVYGLGGGQNNPLIGAGYLNFLGFLLFVRGIYFGPFAQEHAWRSVNPTNRLESNNNQRTRLTLRGFKIPRRIF